MEVVVSRLLEGLAARGHDVGATCIEELGALGTSLLEAGYRVTLVPTLGLRTILVPTALQSWFRGLQPDVVHVHSGAWLKAARATHRAGVSRVVHTFHGILDREPWYGPLLKRWAAQYTERIIVVSAPLRSYLARQVGLPDDAVDIIANGVSTDHFRPQGEGAGIRAALGIGEHAKVIGHVARLAAVKNQLLLIDAFARAHDSLSDSYLVIVGDGPMRHELEQYIRQRGLDECAWVWGPATDLPGVYREFDVFVLSSDAEGTSISLLEAMASGVCVVATSVGGNPAVLGREPCGVLVPPGDPERMAAAILSLLTDRDRRQRFASQGRARAAANYTLDAMLTAYESVYRGESLPSGMTDQAITQIPSS